MMAQLRRAGAWRDWSSAAALFALVLQMALTVAHDPLAAGAAVPGWIGVPLCHVGSGAPASPADPEKSASCPLCLGLAAASGAAIVPPPVQGGIVGGAVIALVLPRAILSLPRQASAAAAQPRAPPAAV